LLLEAKATFGHTIQRTMAAEHQPLIPVPAPPPGLCCSSPADIDLLTLPGRIGFHKTAIDRQLFPSHQPHFHELLHDPFEQLFEQLRFLKPSVSVLGGPRMVRNLLIAETGQTSGTLDACAVLQPACARR
jgi:hypothetical protein